MQLKHKEEAGHVQAGPTSAFTQMVMGSGAHCFSFHVVLDVECWQRRLAGCSWACRLKTLPVSLDLLHTAHDAHGWGMAALWGSGADVYQIR